MTIDRAIQAFGKGFSFTRSFTRPSVFEPMGKLWIIRDAESGKDERKKEVVFHGVTPMEAQAIIDQAQLGWYFVCAIRSMQEPERALKDGWKALGYRLLGHEALMSKKLDDVPVFDSPFPIRRVATQQEADVLNKEAGHRQILPGHVGNDKTIRMYVAWDQERPIGWVRSGRCGRDTWVSNMFVRPDYRRKGIGKALLSQMLLDDKALGFEFSVLLASLDGSRLYPCLGYEQIGELLLFCPKRK